MPLALPDQLASHFSESDEKRIRSLVHRIELDSEDWNEQLIAGEVYDRGECKLSLRAEPDGRIIYDCNCKEFAQSYPRPCVHIAALVRLAQQSLWPSEEAVDEDGISPDFEPVERQIEGESEVPEGRYWKKAISRLRQHEKESQRFDKETWPSGRELIFSIELGNFRENGAVVVETLHRDRKRDGGWGKLHPSAISRRIADAMSDPVDRQIASLLIGANAGGYYYDGYASAMRHLLSPSMAQLLIPMMCRSGRCIYSDAASHNRVTPIAWDEAGAWKLHLDLRQDSTQGYLLSGELRRGDSEIAALSDVLLLTRGGLVFFRDRIAPFEDQGTFDWSRLLAEHPLFRVPKEEAAELVRELNQLPHVPSLTLPAELGIQEVRPSMRPRLRLRAPGRGGWDGDDRLQGELSFDYEGLIVPDGEFTRGILDDQRHQIVLRDAARESAARSKLQELGFRFEPASQSDVRVPRLAAKNLPKVVRALLNDDWHVEAEGRLYRRAGNFQVDVSSGIDWFDLSARVDFDGQVVALPALLAAMRRGETMVPLGDGTYGLLPEEWLARYAALASVAKPEEEILRFSKSQVGLLDALLATQPNSTFDEGFGRTRDELRAFEGVDAIDPPPGFVGQLRPYQRETLGWFGFLRRFNFGGCLADDMGLGKTVQVLALLESRRTDASRVGPSLVVVPRSLVFNWLQEARRFTPQLRVFDHSGVDRPRTSDHLSSYDLIVTTYGTLRRDIAHLKDTRFDYVVLDEAQTIKNPNSESSKAARLLNASHRLVLSGTPVQNHLGDLWSLFEFLNPGMLGAVTAFSSATLGNNGVEAEGRELLARGLRPFILRRTKEQVATDLPARMEQTIYCELEVPQRKLYDELREHYRQSLLGLIDKEGINRAKIQILEALLRLRQAACHPGLIDKARSEDASAKLDMLLPRLVEVTEDGHKALVFSQFTQFLALVRKRLDDAKIPYEYLDGRTRDRQERVARFQSDESCRLFLISLKAGGLGLNLTAADYVFLLDPWWNPAVEAQAIDRSHRIGQTRQVFACRLIAKDTVEEKVLALQQSKRALADAIINADNSLIRSIGREDLALLLS
jgi:superfamily II DNA or RNA helicase